MGGLYCLWQAIGLLIIHWRPGIHVHTYNAHPTWHIRHSAVHLMWLALHTVPPGQPITHTLHTWSLHTPAGVYNTQGSVDYYSENRALQGNREHVQGHVHVYNYSNSVIIKWLYQLQIKSSAHPTRPGGPAKTDEVQLHLWLGCVAKILIKLSNTYIHTYKLSYIIIIVVAALHGRCN